VGMSVAAVALGTALVLRQRRIPEEAIEGTSEEPES